MRESAAVMFGTKADPRWEIYPDQDAKPVAREDIDAAICDLLVWLAEPAAGGLTRG
jgi:hypothetical protein